MTLLEDENQTLEDVGVEEHQQVLIESMYSCYTM
jgi:hypothetical protein